MRVGMMRLKGCPRCKGDIVVERDHWGWYEECIQCGYLRDLQSVVKVKELGGQEETEGFEGCVTSERILNP